MNRTEGRGIVRYVATCLCCLMCVVFFGCDIAARLEQLPSTSAEADIVGDRYRIISEDVHAYGVYALDEKVVSNIRLIAGVGIGGRGVAFKKPVARGQILRILSVWRSHELLSSTVYYVVALEDSELPPVEVRLEMESDNPGVGGGLNPRVYEKLPK